MTEVKSVPVPEAIKQLILSSNVLLQNYQQELTYKVQIANTEMMGILGLDPAHGWKLDTEKMVYFKQEQDIQE
jgi:hypothetical protein